MVKAVWWMERYQETRKCRDPRRSLATLLQMLGVITDTETNGLYPLAKVQAPLDRRSIKTKVLS